MIKRISGGYLAGLPLWLTLRPKTVTSPVDGRVQTVYVVGVEFRGSMDALQAAGYKRALTDAKHELKIANIEDEAKRLISPAAADVTETAAEIQDEYYPEASQAAGPKNASQDQPPELKKPDKGKGPGPGPGPQDQPPESQNQGAQGPEPEKDKPAPLAQPAQAPPKRGRPAKKKTVQKPAADPAGAPGPHDQGGGPPAESPAPAEKEPAPPAAPANQGGNKGQVSLF